MNEIEKGIAKRLKSEEDKNVWDGMLKQKIQPITTQILEECVPKNALKTFRDNAFSVMTISGAKGMFFCFFPAKKFFRRFFNNFLLFFINFLLFFSFFFLFNFCQIYFIYLLFF